MGRSKGKGRKKANQQKSPTKTETKGETKALVEVNLDESDGQANEAKTPLRRSPRKLRGAATDTTPALQQPPKSERGRQAYKRPNDDQCLTRTDEPKGQSRGGQSKKRQGNNSVANATTGTWSVKSESQGKKRKLSDVIIVSDGDETEADSKECEQCLVKDKEISRLEKKIETLVSRDEFDELKRKCEEEKRHKDEALKRLSKMSSHISKDEFDKMNSKYEEEIRRKDEQLRNQKEEASANISKAEFNQMKLKYEEEIRSKDDKLLRQMEEISSYVSKDKFDEMVSKYEKEKCSMDEALKRLKEELYLRVSKDDFDNMKRKYEEEKRSKDEALTRLENEVTTTRISQEHFEKIKRQYEDKTRSKDEEISRLKKEISTRVSMHEYDEMKLKYEEEKRLKNDALLRVSAMASSKLRDNNPNIADLSDQNRPTKIAEKMSELYDNQWTDAFDALQSEMTEEEIIQFLLDILMKTYQECAALATYNFFEKVQRCIEFPIQEATSSATTADLPDQLKQQIKEFRKSRAMFVIKDVENVILDKLQPSNDHLDEVKTYISSCIEISWLMVVQDPPLVLTTKTSSKFDTNMFKDYTKRGPCVEYVVWPALLLHENGALLAKGVAQGCNLNA